MWYANCFLDEIASLRFEWLPFSLTAQKDRPWQALCSFVSKVQTFLQSRRYTHQRPWNWRQVRQALPIFLTKQPEGNQKLALTRQPKSNQNEMMWWTMKILSSHCLTKFFRVLNLRKTSIIYTLSSFEETSDISKLEQFHISDIYLDCKGVKQERFLKFIKVEKTGWKMNLKALFVSWFYLKRRINVSSKVSSSKIDWIWGLMKSNAQTE